MEFINQQLQQLNQVVQSMSVAARVTTVLLLVAIVVAVLYLFRVQVTDGESYLYGGREFSQAEIAAMEDALASAGLNDYEQQGFKIKVPRSNRDQYVRAIAEAGATPRMASEIDGLSESFNPFKSKEQQRQDQLDMVRQQCLKTIEAMPHVEFATVQFDEVSEPGLRRKVLRTASVAVKLMGTREMESEQVEAIRRFVAANKAGLRDHEVTILDLNSNRSYKISEDEDNLAPEANAYTRTKAHWEKYYKDKIEELLRYYRPNVAVSAEISDKLTQTEHLRTLDTTPVAVETNAERSSSSSVTAPLNGTPGVVTNNPQAGGVNAPAQIGQGDTRETTEENSTESSRSVVGGSVSEVERAGMTVEKLKVSIGIPTEFYEELWLERNPPAEGEDPQPMTDAFLSEQEALVSDQIEESIRVLMPQTPQGEDIWEYIYVRTEPRQKIIPVPPESMTDNALAWLASNWQTLGLLFVGLVGLVMLRGVVSGSTPELPEIPSDDPEETAEGGGENADDDSDPDARLHRKFGTSGRSLREELVELVEEDVDAAASVLRTWIGDVG